jgi:hypothetical protein
MRRDSHDDGGDRATPRRTTAMRCALPMSAVPMPDGFEVRELRPTDERDLGQLMADVYRVGPL